MFAVRIGEACYLCDEPATVVCSENVALCRACCEAWGDEVLRTGGVPDPAHPYYRKPDER